LQKLKRVESVLDGFDFKPFPALNRGGEVTQKRPPLITLTFPPLNKEAEEKKSHVSLAACDQRHQNNIVAVFQRGF
jgi:hypothetical protein